MAAKSVDQFSGFPAEGLAFLTKLGTKDKAWFDKNRSTYDEMVVGPTKAFVIAMGEEIADTIAPDIVALPKANGSIAPINNDLRFSPDKSPYKDHLLLRFWDGASKKTAPTLMVRISEDTIGFASGAPIGSLDDWRALVDNDKTGSELETILAALGKGRPLDVDGQGYKKVPKPYADDHPRADLLRHKHGLQARWAEPAPASVNKAAFVGWCGKRLDALSDLHAWFKTNL